MTGPTESTGMGRNRETGEKPGGEKPGTEKPGTDGTVPISRRYAAKTIPSCRESPAGFFGRPTFRALSARKVECSSAATNSADPSGRPV
jgi:hypothetical protein